MPDDTPEPNLTESSESEESEQPEKYTDEWYDSVEQRFKDLGDYIKRGGSHSHARTKQAATQAPATPDSGESTPEQEADRPISASAAVDTRPPKPNHIWFRRFGE